VDVDNTRIASRNDIHRADWLLMCSIITIFGPAITIIDREAYDPGMHAGAGF